MTGAGAAPPGPPPFSGAVLTGGRSRRMGTDKALLDVGGRPLAAVAAGALRAAGAAEVMAVGGDLDALAALGLRPVPDTRPGEGPLGGVLDALAAARHDPVVVLACDLPWVEAGAVAALLAALADPAADAAVPVAGGRRQVLLAAYRRRSQAALGAAFDDGTRALHRAVAGLRVVEVALADERWAVDVDDPAGAARLDRWTTPGSPD